MKILNEILPPLITFLIIFLLKKSFKKRRKIATFFKSHLRSVSIAEIPFYYYCRLAASIMPVLGCIQIGSMYLQSAAIYKMALVSIPFIYNYILFTAVGDDLFKRLNIVKVKN